MGAKYIIDGDILTDVGDAIREQNCSTARILPQNMADSIRDINSGLYLDVNAGLDDDDPDMTWTRPTGYPDLDAITIPDDFDGVYMTYDLTKTEGYGWIGVYCNCQNDSIYTVERGHLENNVFVTDYTQQVNRNSYFRQALDSTDGNIQLWRVSSTGHITRLSLATNSNENSKCMNNNMQPIVERRGVLPYVTNVASQIGVQPTYGCMGTIWLERDNLIIGEKSVITNLNGMYMYCYRIQQVNLNWSTSVWNVVNMESMFDQCFRLESVDFSSWDTSNWAMTYSIANMFKWCKSLKTIDLSNWDTSGWAITSMGSTFNNCTALKEINLSGWDTSNWVVSNLGSMFSYSKSIENIIGLENLNTSNWVVNNITSMFYQCYCIESLDLSKWNTANWAVTNMNGMFNSCHCLKELNISTWDTSNWAVTNIGSTFYACYVLKELDLSNWDTANWTVTSMESCWTNCFNIQDLDLSSWNTSNWLITGYGFRYSFQNMHSVKQINLTGWDTSNWSLTDIRNAFSGCRSLESIPGINNFNTSNWKCTIISNLFSDCNSLKDIDLSNWDTSEWEVTSIAGIFARCYRLKNNGGIGGWDTSNWKLTTIEILFNLANNVESLDFSQWDIDGTSLTTGVYYLITESYDINEVIFPNDFDLSHITNSAYINLPNIYTLKNCNFYKVKNANMSVNFSNSLSIASLLQLINKLQTVTVARTLTLGQSNINKLTPEQIAIATQKGWTVI